MCCAGHGNGSRLTHLCVVLVMVMGLTLLTCVLCLSWGWVSPACCAGHDVLVMEMGLALLTCVLCWSLGWASPYSPVCCAGHGNGPCLAHLCGVLVMGMGLSVFLTCVLCWSWGWVSPCSPVCCAGHDVGPGHGDGSSFCLHAAGPPAAFSAADFCRLQFSFSFLCIRDWEEEFLLVCLLLFFKGMGANSMTKNVKAHQKKCCHE